MMHCGALAQLLLQFKVIRIQEIFLQTDIFLLFTAASSSDSWSMGAGNDTVGFSFSFAYSAAGGTVTLSSFDDQNSPFVLMEAASIELPASSSPASRALYWVISAHVGPQT